MKSFEYHGLWWLPNYPEHKVAGFLTFSQEGNFTLETIGALRPPNTPKGIYFLDLINGDIVGGKKITLVDCSQIYHSHNTSNEIESSKYKVSIAYEGIHFKNYSELTFSHAYVIYTYLWEWAGVSGLQSSLGKGISPIDSITYSPPKDIYVQHNDTRISIIFRANPNIERKIGTLKEWTQLSFYNPTERTFEQISKDFIFPLQTLITLGTTKPNFVEAMYFVKESVSLYPIQVYYQQRFYQTNSDDIFDNSNLLFNLLDFQNKVGNLFEDWLNLAGEIDEVLQLFFRSKVSPDLYSELRFLTLAQALETFHRRRRQGAILSKDSHKQKMNEIIQNVPDNYKKWLKEALAFSNEKSLKIRLTELMDEAFEVMQPLLNNKEEFIKKVRDTRNYLTHFDQRMKDKTATDSELHWMTEKLSILLQSCLLKEINITATEQLNLFNRNRFYDFLKSR